MSDRAAFKAGSVVSGPDGEGYRLTRDLHVGDVITVDCLEPFGGAPLPVAGELMPRFMAEWVAKGMS